MPLQAETHAEALLKHEAMRGVGVAVTSSNGTPGRRQLVSILQGELGFFHPARVEDRLRICETTPFCRGNRNPLRLPLQRCVYLFNQARATLFCHLEHQTLQSMYNAFNSHPRGGTEVRAGHPAFRGPRLSRYLVGISTSSIASLSRSHVETQRLLTPFVTTSP